MEIELQNGSKISLEPDSKVNIGRNLGSKSDSLWKDRTVSLNQLSLHLINDPIEEYVIKFEVIGKNPIWVHRKGDSERKIYRKFETDELRSGDEFSLSIKKPFLCIVMKKEREIDEEEISFEEIGCLDLSKIDPVKDRIAVEDINMNVVTPSRSELSSLREGLDKATRLLVESNRIAIRADGYKKRIRMINIKKQEIYTSLVSLYTDLFQSQWKEFREVSEAYQIDGAPQQGWEKLARVYISHWFKDLYVSIRNACYQISPIAFSDKFQDHADYESQVYDSFLVRLMTNFRPTRIVGALEDAMYIPVIDDEPNLGRPDPFRIGDTYLLNAPCLRGILALMNENRIGWNLSNITNELTGRPFWLFDWHGLHTACAWFPFQENFNIEDVAVAYIVGVACTPQLGAQDIDEWQQFQNNIIPEQHPPELFQRLTPRSFYGSFELRTIELNTLELRYNQAGFPTTETSSSRSKRPRNDETGITPEPSSSGPVALPMEIFHNVQCYRLIDWVYFYKVIHEVTLPSRIASLRKIVIGHDSPAPN